MGDIKVDGRVIKLSLRELRVNRQQAKDNAGTSGVLKRLPSHKRESLTQHLSLEDVDVKTLFYGDRNSLDNKPFAGMSAGISVMLQYAIANSIQANKGTSTSKSAKVILDEASQGEWRVFQKVGWGPKDTRDTTEVVVLAHVCALLPRRSRVHR